MSGVVLCHRCGLQAERTQTGRLPPWEVAKACAYSTVIAHVGEMLDRDPHEFLGKRVDEFIAEQLTLVGGGHPQGRAVRTLVAKHSGGDYYPGKPRENPGGRPHVITEHQKQEIARAAMDLKKRKLDPSPALVRAKLPRLTVNRTTGKPISDEFIRGIFKDRCYDETEDDPWRWLPNPSKDYLTDAMKENRVTTAEYVLNTFPAAAWVTHVSVDPCSTLLARTPARLEEQQLASMGKIKWRSKGSTNKGTSTRAPSTTNTQKGSNTLQVFWTPVFARGKIAIYVCDPDANNCDAPSTLNKSGPLACFVRKVLPELLGDMKQRHGWNSIPRVLVHDKASYMVNTATQQLNQVFGGALSEAGFRSWTGPQGASTQWLASHLGDVYLHETAISHIRRLLREKFVCLRVGETSPQFKQRMNKVQDYMNSEEFAREPDGRGLPGLAKDLRARCEQLLDKKGERLPY
jgi:hypothetical protein